MGLPLLEMFSCLSGGRVHEVDLSSCSTAPLSPRCESQTSGRMPRRLRCSPGHGCEVYKKGLNNEGEMKGLMIKE